MEKWDVVRIFCADLVPPHDKFCICVCPERALFMFINSDPPMFRKARDLAIEMSNFEVHFLARTSYVDTTKLMSFDRATVERAWAEERRRMGKLAPSIIKRIQNGVLAHEVMPNDQRDLFKP